jgi:hypothetical protein
MAWLSVKTIALMYPTAGQREPNNAWPICGLTPTAVTSQGLFHFPVWDCVEQNTRLASNHVSVAVIELHGTVARVEEDFPRAFCLRSALKFSQDFPSDTSSLHVAFDGHIPNLRLLGSREVDTTDAHQTLSNPSPQVDSIAFVLIALASAALQPGLAKNMPSQVVVLIHLLVPR